MEEELEQEQGVVIGEIGIIEDVLRRLPFKSLVRFQCVSKQWRSLISDPAFLRKHTSCAGGGDDSRPWKFGRIVESPRHSVDDFSLITFYGDGKHGIVGFDNMARPDVTFKPSIFGSCEGLLLVRIADNDFVMWNPYTRSSRRISGLCPGTLVDADLASGLAYDKETDDYKAVVIVYPRNGAEGVHLYVFSYRRNSWTRKDSSDFPYELKYIFFNGITVNCSPHWVVKRSPIPHSLVYFHAATEKFRELPLPRNMRVRELDFVKLGLLKGRLSLTLSSGGYSRDVEVWSMMKHGEVESWTMLHTLKVPSGSCFLRPVGYCTSDGREALVMEKDRKQLVVFDVSKTTSRRRRITATYCDHPNDTFSVYFESIVSPWGL